MPELKVYPKKNDKKAKDDAMISEAEQAVMKLKETEDTLQSQVAQNLDSEAHNRDGSDIERKSIMTWITKRAANLEIGEMSLSRSGHLTHFDRQKKVLEDMKRAHEAELRLRVKVSEMQDQLAMLEEERRKEAERRLY